MMAQSEETKPRPSQAEGEPEPGATSDKQGEAPGRPSQAEGEGSAGRDQQDDPTLHSGATSGDVGGRSRVQQGGEFRAGQTTPSAGQNQTTGAQGGVAPRPSQAEGEPDPGSTSDSKPRPSQAEGEPDKAE